MIAALLALTLAGNPDAVNVARVYEARHLSDAGSKTKCRSLAAFDVRAFNDELSTLDAFENVIVSPHGGPDRVESARVRFFLTGDGEGLRVTKRESLDEQLAAYATPDALLAAPETWTTQLVLALTKRAVRLFNESRTVDGEQLLFVAEQIAHTIGDTGALSQALSARSIGLRHREQNELALALAEEAAALAATTGDADLLATAELRLGRAIETAGRRDVTPFLRILGIADQLEEIAIAGLAASQAAKYHDDRSEHRQAFHYTNLAMKYAEQSGDARARVSAMLNLAGAYFQQGDWELAAEYWRRTSDVARETGMIMSAAHALRFSADAESQRGNVDAALSLLSQALSLVAKGPTEAPLTSDIELVRAETLLRARRIDEAQQALDHAIALTGRTTYARALTAEALLARGKPEAALEELYRLAELPRNVLSNFDRTMIAEAWRALGYTNHAVTVLRDLICESERERAEVSGDARQRWLFLERTIEPYRELLEILAEIGDADGAWEIAESIKARSLAESIVDINRPQSAGAEEEQRVDAEIRRLNLALQSGRGDVEALRKQLLGARIDLADIRARLRFGSPATASAPTPPRERANAPMLILEYAQTEPYFLLFAIRRDANEDRLLAMHRISAPDVHKAVARVVEAVRQRNLRYDEYARPLYDLLLAPVEPLVAEAKMIGVLPDGELWRVPFQALPSKNGYLIDRAPIFLAPSLAVLDQNPARSKRVPASVLAFAHKLPGTEREALDVASLYDRSASRVLLGADARESVLKYEAADYDVLHFATHGVADEVHPLFSYLLLSSEGTRDDGLLEAREIASLDLRADVAVLSACSTASGRVHAGEGVIGLSWAFLAAGCPRTVVSQWEAASSATAILMRTFHRGLRSGRSTPAALRAAALELRNHPQYRHPFYWAPFVVVGVP